jgi:hypothetical protein
MLLFIVPVSFVVFRHLIATFPYLSVNEGTCSANVQYNCADKSRGIVVE